MKKLFAITLVAAIAAGTFATVAAQAPKEVRPEDAITQPLTPRAGLRLTEFFIHDPWILAEKSTQTYYLYTSAPARLTGRNRTGTFAYKSKDLATWEGPFVVFTCPDDSWATRKRALGRPKCTPTKENTTCSPRCITRRSRCRPWCRPGPI